MIGMYRIAIFKIRPELDSTGYQTNYPAGTGYLLHNSDFLVYFVVRIKKMYYSQCLFSALCAHTLHRSTTNICKTVGLHDSLLVSHLDQPEADIRYIPKTRTIKQDTMQHTICICVVLQCKPVSGG